MSSIAITAPTTRLRLTARGRRVVAFLVSLPIVAALAVVVVIGGGSALASGVEGAPVGSFTEVTVMNGDTLWSIAEDVAPHADPRDVVAAISRLNALDGGVVAAGQRLAIPAQYTQAG